MAQDATFVSKPLLDVNASSSSIIIPGAKKKSVPSVQARFEDSEANTYWLITNFCQAADSFAEIGTDARDRQLRDYWHKEPILAGIISTMVDRFTTVGWALTGPPRKTREYTKILQNMGDGAGWDTEMAKWALDYLTQDRGALLEKGRRGRNGPVAGLYYMDIGACSITNSHETPFVYNHPEKGEIPLRRDDIIHRVSLPNGQESKYGSGFCFVTRALKAVRLAIALGKYEDDALNDMPPDGVAAVTGMAPEAVKQAIELWQANKGSKDLTFRRLLWFVGNPLAAQPVDVKWVPFSEPPKGWTRRDVIETYVKTLALCAGEDPNEFWLYLHAGATKGIGQIQHMKARGKGVGKILAVVERMIDWEVVPEGCRFSFDAVDDESDLLRQQIRSSAVNWIKNAWLPSPTGQQLISTPLAQQLLMREGCITQADMTAQEAFEDENGAPKTETEHEVLEMTDEGEDLGASVGQPQVTMEEIDKAAKEQKDLAQEIDVLPAWMKKDIDERVAALSKVAESITAGKEAGFLENEPPET